MRRGPLDPEAAAQMVEDVGSALALAHSLGVVHGAVTPETIVVDEEGRAHLANFGVAAEAGTASSDVRDLAIALGYALTGRRPTGDDAVPSELPPALAQVVKRAVSGPGYHDADSFVAAVRAALGTAAPPAEATRFNPYKGLRPFEEADSADFFGRERLVERLLARLGESGTRGRFIALVGPSGSGKSSVVNAGLLPALRGGAFPGSGEWFVADITPGPHPYEELEAALLAHRGQSAAEPARPAARRRDRDTPGGEAGASRPTVPPAAGHRPVRGAVHPGAGGDGQRLPRCARRRRRRPAEPAPGVGHAARRLL